MRTKTAFAILMLTMLALPLLASAADYANWSVTMYAPDQATIIGTGTFRADTVPTYVTPVVDFKATVSGTDYQALPPSDSVFLPLYNNYWGTLFGFVLSSPDDGASVPCIGFAWGDNPSNWEYCLCNVLGGQLMSATSTGTYGWYTIETGPAGTPAVLSGFYPPVDSPAVATNLAKAGQTIPLKFYAEAVSGPITDLTTVDLSIISTDCENLDEGVDAIDSYSNGTSVTLENLGGGYYQYNWKTVKGETGCRLVTLALPETYTADALVAAFKFRK